MPSPKSGDAILMIGTRKGGFLLSSDRTRSEWVVHSVHFPGSDVFHMTRDPRSGTLLAAVNSVVWGPEIQRSDDFGGSWSGAEGPPKFADSGGYARQSVDRVWHIEPGWPSEPGVVYLGAQPASLFRSEDGGDRWDEVPGLSSHPTQPDWKPGLGGLILHSMALDPKNSGRMWVGLSAVGVFRTEDAGESWQPVNTGVRADFAPDPFPAFGQCPHELLSPVGESGILYQQNHCGVFRSVDAGDHWDDLSDGLPSRFGFILGVNPNDPNNIFVMPEDEATTDSVGGGKRYTTDAKMRVYRSQDGGDSWDAVTDGLPQTHAYVHAMREGMALDGLDPRGVYIGTTAGKVFHSAGGGEHWQVLIEDLPPINSVEVATLD